MTSQGLDPFILSAERFGALSEAETAKYAKIIKAANIKIEN